MEIDPLVPHGSANLPAAGGGRPAAAGTAASDFSAALSRAKSGSPGGDGAQSGSDAGAGTAPLRVQVKPGDTLTGLVRAHYRQAGVALTNSQAAQLAEEVAARNSIKNADLIRPGQVLDLSALGLPNPPTRGTAPDTWPTAQSWLAGRPQATAANETAPSAPRTTERAGVSATRPLTSGAPAGNPVLARTIDRAVQKGFIPPHEAQAVRQRIRQLADDYGFSPDDFALVTLAESDGMNPQASNGRCHGIIQFCDGDSRGAASVGFSESPKTILGMSVLQQLELVDRYFKDTGLRQVGPKKRTDDLYLTVLTPAARNEKRRDAPLNIAGQQAAFLYVDHDRQAGITRNSLVAGLHYNAAQRLGMDTRGAAQLSRARLTDAMPVSWLQPTDFR